MKLTELIIKAVDLYSLKNIKGNNLCIGCAVATTSDLKNEDGVKKTKLK